MKRRMYSIRDNRTSFNPPHEGYNDPAAVRDFEFIMNKNDMMRLHPADYDLYFIGFFDSDSAVFESVSPIQFVCSGSSVVYGGNDIEEH